MDASSAANDTNAATTTDATPAAPPATTVEPLERLKQIRATVMPILRPIAEEYVNRGRVGYPKIIDSVERGGVFGINLDPGYGVYFMTDGADVYAELHRTHLRTDALSAANVEKFAGRPEIIRRDLPPDATDLDYRNLVSELLSWWNYQQLMIFKVDS